MLGQPMENLHKARKLYQEILNGDHNFGCVEVSLQTLGIPMHYMDVLEREERGDQKIGGLVEKAGLITNWIVTVQDDLTPDDLSNLLEDRLLPDFASKPGTIVGYFCLELYPSEMQRDSHHASAILNRNTLPRNVRRNLKKRNSYIVANIMNGGFHAQTVQELCHRIQKVCKSGGQFQIAQLKHPQGGLR
jgi:hypothetical protein